MFCEIEYSINKHKPIVTTKGANQKCIIQKVNVLKNKLFLVQSETSLRAPKSDQRSIPFPDNCYARNEKGGG